MKRRPDLLLKVFVSAVLCLVWVSFGAAEARSINDAESGSSGGDLVGTLNLTSEQQAQLGTFRKRSLEEKSAIATELRECESKLKDELSKPESDRVKVEDLTSRLKRLQGQLVDSQVQDISRVKEVLTPRQREVFEDRARQLREGSGRSSGGSGRGRGGSSGRH